MELPWKHSVKSWCPWLICSPDCRWHRIGLVGVINSSCFWSRCDPCCGFVPSIQVVAFRQSLSPDRFGFLLNNDWVAALSVALQSIKGDRWLVIASHLWLSTICSQTGFAPSSPIFSGRISDEVWSCKKRSWRHSAKPVYIAILFVRLAEVLMSNEERGDSCQRLNLKDFPACLMPMWGEGLPIRTCSALHNLT